MATNCQNHIKKNMFRKYSKMRSLQARLRRLRGKTKPINEKEESVTWRRFFAILGVIVSCMLALYWLYPNQPSLKDLFNEIDSNKKAQYLDTIEVQIRGENVDGQYDELDSLFISIDSGNWTDAINRINQLLKLTNKAKSHLFLLKGMLRIFEFEQSNNHGLLDSAEIDLELTNDKRKFYWKGRVWQGKQKYDSALYYYKKSINEDSSYYDAYIKIYDLCRAGPEEDSAINLLKRAKNSYPTVSEINLALAEHYRYSNNTDLYIEELSNAMDKFDHNYNRAKKMLFAEIRLSNTKVTGFWYSVKFALIFIALGISIDSLFDHRLINYLFEPIKRITGFSFPLRRLIKKIIPWKK